jgi:enoyl-CoA hydratase/carnithine racemase
MTDIDYKCRDRIAYITLTRPEAKNAVTPEMREELGRVWAAFRDDDETDDRGDKRVGVSGWARARAASITVTAESQGWSNMVTKVVPHEELVQDAELLARQILRNSQRAVGSAKETTAASIEQRRANCSAGFSTNRAPAELARSGLNCRLASVYSPQRTPRGETP